MNTLLLLSLIVGCGKDVDETGAADDTADDTAAIDTDDTAASDDTDDTDPGPTETGDSATDSGPTGSDDTGDCEMVDWFADADGDGFGDPEVWETACEGPPDSVVEGPADCDDGDETIHPGAVEICDGADNDCDPATSEDGLVATDGASFGTIQDAVDGTTGGHVLVCPGVYVEILEIRDAVTIEGIGGADVTIIDGGEPFPSASTVSIQGPGATLSGLTITGGTGTLNDGGVWGGGVYAGQSDGVVIVDCVIEGNTADFAGGVVGTGQYPDADLIQNTVIRGNTATQGGGGFLFFHAELEGVEVTGNEAPTGGGGMAWYWDVRADADTRIHDNVAGEAGGGLMIWDDGEWYGGEIADNRSEGRGGGVVIWDVGALGEATIAGNTAAEGGGVAIDEARATLSDLDVRGNVAEVGGGLYMGDSRVSLETSAVEENRSSESGGGAWITTSTFQSIDSDWGEDKTDNDPDDVVLDLGVMTVTYAAGAGASFTCSTTGGGCEE